MTTVLLVAGLVIYIFTAHVIATVTVRELRRRESPANSSRSSSSLTLAVASAILGVCWPLLMLALFIHTIYKNASEKETPES